MGFNTSGRVTAGRQGITAAIEAIRWIGRAAAERRAAIAEDPALRIPINRDLQSRAYAEAETDSVGHVLAQRQRADEAATAIYEEMEAYRQYGERPGPAAQLAGQRLQRVLDAGVPLSTVVQTAIGRRDDDALAWLQWAIPDEAARAVAAGGAPGHATGRPVQRQSRRLYETVVDARLPNMAHEDREYHTTRRELGRLFDRLDAHARLAVAEAKGLPTDAHRMRAGLLDDDRWTGMLERAENDPGWDDPEAVGPVTGAVEA